MLGNYDENRILISSSDESIKCADSQSKHCVMFPKTMPKGAVQDLLMTFPSLTLGEGMSAEKKLKPYLQDGSQILNLRLDACCFDRWVAY